MGRFFSLSLSLFLIITLTLGSAHGEEDEWEDVGWNGGIENEADEEAWLAKQQAKNAEELQKEWSENVGWTDASGQKSTHPKPVIEFLRPQPGEKLSDAQENVFVEFFVHNVDPSSGVSAILYLGGGNPTRISDFQNRIHVTVTQLKPGTYTFSVVLVDKNRNPMNIENSIVFERVATLPMTTEQIYEKTARERLLDPRVFEISVRYYSAQNKPDDVVAQAEKLVKEALLGEKIPLPSPLSYGRNESSKPPPPPLEELSAEEREMMAATRDIVSDLHDPTRKLMKERGIEQKERNDEEKTKLRRKFIASDEEEEEEKEEKKNAAADGKEGEEVRKVAAPLHENGADDAAKSQAVLDAENEKKAREAAVMSSHVMTGTLLFVQGALQLFNKAKQDLRAALPLLSEAAAAGNSNAHLFLAVLWTSGDEEVGGKIDETAALFHFKKCADMGHPVCKMAMGYRYLHGFGGVEKSCEDAALNFRHAADLTLAFATENAGFPPLHKTRLSEFREIQMEEQNEEIEQLEQMKAEMGGEGAKEAHMFLGLHRYFGTGKSEGDRAAAIEHFESAAEGGNGLAYNNLGTIYLNGVGVERNYSKAFELFSLSASMGDHWGVNSLAACYWHGYHVPANKSHGLLLYKQAASMGNPNAHFNLGCFYREGTKGLKRDYAKALEHLEFAARQGQADALLSIGLMHQSGEGVEPSCQTAVNCFKKAAEHGPWGALLQEGYRAFKHNDMLGAYFRYAIAAEAGYSTAQANVGWLHEHGYGRGALEPKAAAMDMYSLAAEQGDIPALRLMGDMHFYGHSPQGKDFAKAALFYSKAKDFDDHALFNLAYMHENGLGVPLDAHAAVQMYGALAESDLSAALPGKLANMKMRAIALLQQNGILTTDISNAHVTYVTAAACFLLVSVVVLLLWAIR